MNKLFFFTMALVFISGCSSTPTRTGCISGNCVNGNGTYVWSSGGKYSGGWRNDKKHGYGTYTWADGDSRSGYYLNGKRVSRSAYKSASSPKSSSTSSSNKCRNRNAAANAYKGFVTGLNLLLGGAKGAEYGYRESSKQTRWLECD